MLCALSAFLGVALAPGQAAKTAVFVNVLGGPDLAERAEGFQSLLADPLNGRGYSVLSQREIAEALEDAPPGESDPATMLATQTSALRLAQTLGVDYILVANLVSLGAEQKQFSGSGIATDNRTYTLRTSYGLLDAGDGGGITGDKVVVAKTIRSDQNLQVEDADVINQLLEEAAAGIAARLTAPGTMASLPPPSAKGEPVTFMINIRLQDIGLPNVLIGPEGQVKVTDKQFPVEAMGVDVTLDGIVQGSAPGEFAAMPGIHRLRLTREGFTPWERNVNLYQGFVLNASMNLNAEGLAQWQELTEFLQDLQNDTQINQGQVKVLEGRAQALEQSGFKVDTEDAPTINLFNSLWGPDLLNPIPFE